MAGPMRYWIPKSRSPKFLLIGLGLLAVLGLFFARPGLLEYRLWQARRALNDREARQALVWLDAAERLDADCSDVHFFKARAYRRLGEYDKVGTALDRALRLGHSVDQAKREDLMTLAQNGQLSKAEPHLPKLLIDADEDGPEICEAFVRGYLNAFRVNSAFKLLDSWQADYPDDPQPHYCRGIFREYRKSWSEAADSFRRALELAPHRHDVRLHLARVLREQHQYQEAEEHYRQCLEKKTDEPEALAGLGECLRDEGKLEQAREVFARLLEGSPDHFDGRLAVGEMELDAGRPEEALRRLEPLADERPHDSNVRYALAKALSQAGQAERAREHFKFAAAAQEAKIRVESLLRRVIDEPSNVEGRYEIGTLLLKYGDASTGSSWLRSVLQFDPDHRATHAALADYYREQGNAALAAKHRRLAETAEKSDHGS